MSVSGHPLWTELWAPLGLRYHALHHVAPGLPYHVLGKAHRRLRASPAAGEDYSRLIAPGLASALGELAERRRIERC